jgi:hypothetical protein
MKPIFAFRRFFRRPVGRGPLFPFPIANWICLMLLLAQSLRAQTIDLNTNGMSDVWEQIYGASALLPDADADGDGASNLMEALAGTNPFNTNSLPKISAAGISASGFTVTLAVELGKQYQLQSVSNLASTNWFVETNVIVRSGSSLSLSAAAGVNGKFFRTAVSDVDTDGDGLNDWEEYKLGLDPFDPVSNGQLDYLGQLLNDYAYATGKFASQNTFFITATRPTTVQPDPGQPASDTGLLTIARGGFPLRAVTVSVTLGTGAGYATEGLDHSFLPRFVTFPAGVSSQNISVTPLADTNLQTSVIAMMKLLPGTNYFLTYASNASVVIYPSMTPRGTGLWGNYFTNSSTTYTNTNNFNPSRLILGRVDPVINFNYTNGTSPNLSNGAYTVRWTGQVQPQYSELYYFVVNSDDGCRLWINDQLIIDKWQSQGATDQTGTISLQAGVRYNLKLEYLQVSGAGSVRLYWYGPSQAKTLIPTERLYPTNTPAAPASVTSPLTAVAFLGQPFSFNVTGANSPTNFTATGLPPGLSFSSTNGLISGIPSLAGNFQVALTVSNSLGLSAAALNLQVLDTGSAVVREVWLGVPGNNLADIPLNTPATLTNVLGTLEGMTNYGVNYGERIRGYFTATNNGNYYFWLAASDAAELWISNDSEPANKIKRASVSPDGGGTTFRNWTAQTNQQSKWLSLVAGQKYYLEILHKAGTTPNDHWSVGWSQDPVGTNSMPTAIVPGYVLGRYYPLPIKLLSGTLYSANLLALPNASSLANGTATLALSADGSKAVLNYAVNGIPGTHIDHIYADPYLNNPKTLLYDIAAELPQADGSYLWNLAPVGSLSVADIREILIQGKATIEIQTPAFPAGEIGGHFTLANGSQTFTAPPAPPAWPDDHADANAAARFLIQSTFGPSTAEIANVQALGYGGWISNQFALPVGAHLPIVVANRNPDPTTPWPSSLTYNTWWRQSISAPDQLRQRVAFALSEIMVVSDNGTLLDQATCLSGYYDTLLKNAFGNFRDLLRDVTLTPAMGLYLDMRGNDAGSLITGLHANENYAREILQLFSVGLYRMWPDGSLVLNSQNALVPTYDQNVILGFASTFTGWNYYQTNQANGRLPTSFSPASNYTNPMVLVPTRHELGTKKLLDNVMIPAAVGAQTNSSQTNFDVYCSQNLEAALDSIYNNPNVGPFICRQLIQRLVTSHPSRDYLYRVVQKFNDNGSGVRGDLKAVVQAILLDYEARSPSLLNVPTFGKQREPLLRVTAAARAFPAPANNGGTYTQSGSQTITVTTTNAHRLNTGDTVALNFADSSGNPPPPSQNYSVTFVSSNSVNLTAPNLITGTYSQNTNLITVTISGHGLVAGNAIYLTFTTGGAISGLYAVITNATANVFTVATPDGAVRSGNCLFPRLAASGFTQTSTNVTVFLAAPHGLATNQTFFVNINTVLIPPGQYQVKTIPTPNQFTFNTTNALSTTQGGFNLYPFGPPPVNRNGTVSATFNTWNMGASDTDATYNLSQTPLSAPTVFNYFFPDYAFPGTLASAGLTTPEFQLTSDTSVALQMNYLQAGILGNTGNSNGLSSFQRGNGAVTLDVGPWLNTNLTANAGIPALVDSLNSLLVAGQLAPAAKTRIVNYVTNLVNFPYATPPTALQQRDRVRAVAHLILCSPDFTVQQ